MWWCVFFFFNDTATTEIYTLSLHDALPISGAQAVSFILESDGAGGLTWIATPSGVSDHGALTGLADDDHTQYHNDTRGDARYLQLTGGTLTGDVTMGSGVFLSWNGDANLRRNISTIFASANGTDTILRDPAGTSKLWVQTAAFYSNATTHYFRDNSSVHKFRIDSAGNIHQKGVYHYFGINSNDWMSFDDTANKFRWYVDNSNAMALHSNASNDKRLGLNDDTPDAQFDCNGAILALQAYMTTTSATQQVLQMRSNVGGTNLEKWVVYGNGDTKSTTGVYGTLSDERLKDPESIVLARDYSDDLRAIDPYKYRFKGNDVEMLGYVAQRVQDVKPGLVSSHVNKQYEMNPDGSYAKDENGNRISWGVEELSVKTSLLIPMLHSGWRAHDSRIAAIEERLGI